MFLTSDYINNGPKAYEVNSNQLERMQKAHDMTMKTLYIRVE